MMYRKTYAEINLSHLKANANRLRALDPGQFFCPMIKTNAYGHGDVEVAMALKGEDVHHLGVAFIEEGQRLREKNVDGIEILVFGVFDDAGAEALIEYRLTPVISTWQQIAALEKVLSPGTRYGVHLKFNTGMNRLGFPLHQAKSLVDYFRSKDHVELAGVCTHLTKSEDYFESGGHTRQQMDQFQQIQKLFTNDDLHFHVFNSGGLLAHSVCSSHQRRSWGSRPGIAIYGCAPKVKALSEPQEEQLQKLQLKKVMALKTELISIHAVAKGQGVSYGRRWVAEQDSVIGVIPIGYGDGYSRLLSNRAKVLYRERKVPVVGTVCMDYTMVDLTAVLGDRYEEIRQQDSKTFQLGETMTLFQAGNAEKISVVDLAEQAETISYELLTTIGRRVQRIFR